MIWPEGVPIPYLLEVPVPPSLNTYYENAKRVVRAGPKAGKSYTGKMISAEGLRFRGEVMTAARRGHRLPPKLRGRLRIVVYYCKDTHTKTGAVRNVRSDGDNLWKALCDALTKADVIKDDCLFDDHRIVRGNPVPGGRVAVAISPADPDRSMADVAAAGIKLVIGTSEGLPF